MGAAAGALLPGQHTDVPGAVAEQGEGLLGDGSEHQLALAALGEDLSGVRVDDLGDEVVLVDVHARLLAALKGHARAAGLREAVDVIGLDAQLLLNVPAHLLAPGLGAEDAGLQLDLVPQAPLLDALRQVGGVGGGAAEDGGAQVHHELELPVGVAAGHGQGQAAHLMAAAVEAGTAGEQAVAVADMAHILVGAAGSDDGPGAAVLPQVDVVLGVEGHHPLAGGARGGLDADAVLQGPGQQAVGVGLPQVVLGEEGELVEVLHALYVVGGDALLLHLLPVVGDGVPHVPHLLDQALVLPGQDLLPAGTLDLRLVVTFHRWSP